MDEKLKRKNMENISFLRLCYILRAIRAGRCRERRYADHTFIQTYFRMHHFVVKFSKFSSPQAARGHCPLTKILRTFLHIDDMDRPHAVIDAGYCYRRPSWRGVACLLGTAVSPAEADEPIEMPLKMHAVSRGREPDEPRCIHKVTVT